MIENIYDPKITELSGSQELEKARKDAEDDAFQYIKKIINQSSSLESLEQDKQQSSSKHQSKIALLKSQVQGIVTNIESGIEELQGAANGLKELKDEINSIDDETNKREQVFSENDQILHDLALAFERANIIEDLLNSFENADEVIKSITQYFEKNPDAYSIKLYKTLESLINFKEDLQTKLSDPKLKTFIEEHFDPVHKFYEKLLNNVRDCLNEAFKRTPDELIRANWIMCAHKERDAIAAYLLCAMKNETLSALEKVDQNNSKEYLKTISGMIDYLPEKTSLLSQSLPDGIDGTNLINEFVNSEIFQMLSDYRNRMPNNAALVDAMIKCLNDIKNSLRALLGMELDDKNKFSIFLNELNGSFENILMDDYQKFLDNIINLDIDSVETKRDGTYYTQGPKDLIDRLQDAYNFAKKSASDTAAKALPTLVQRLANAFYQLGKRACDSYDMKYIIACCNNSVEAVKIVNEFAKTNSETIIEDYRGQGDSQLTTKEASSLFTKTLQKPWNDMKNQGLTTLSKIVISRVIANDDDFRYDFNDKLDSITKDVQNMSEHLFQPLYMKFLSIFSRELIPHYIQSFFAKEFQKPKTQDEFSTLVTHECNALSQLFQNFEPRLCKSSIIAIEAFRDLMIEPYEDLHEIFHIIAKEYNDFDPNIGIALVKIRVDAKDNKSEIPEVLKGFVMMYENVDKSRGDKYFTYDPESNKKFSLF